jgi:DNA polymerase III subunit delta'
MAWEWIRGHDAVREQLAAAHSRGRLAHAYLFVGPQGVGKHLFATELAKSLLCDHAPAPLTACDKCPSCAQVGAGTHPDYFTARKPDDKHELPAEVIREFCGHLGLKPSKGSRRVGVVGDADDFNEESANAFLKSLEEPPPGSVLILLATSTEQQLSTILSRCQVIRFHPLTPDDVRAVLADQEIVEPARVTQLVRLAHGSPGQAIALNDDDLWAFRETAVNTLTSTRPDPVGFASAWAKFVEEAGKESAAQRARASLVVRLLMDTIQTALRVAVGASVDDDKLRRFAERVGPDQLADMLEACVEAVVQIERRVQVVLVIELLADRLCHTPVAV